MPTRREALALAGALALSGRASAARAKAPVVNGNLVPPIDTDKPLDSATAAQVRAAGLTALKLSLGGSGNRNRTEVDGEIGEVERFIALNPGLFLKVAQASDLATARTDGRTGIILSFEAGEPLEGRIEAIDHFAARGVRVMGLTYNVATPFASGVLSPRSIGLTPLGRDAIDRMNDRGVTLDLSHTDEPSSLAALTASARPALVTHAGCAALHAHPRNKSDALIRTLADRGGVIGIYELSFLVPAPRQPALDDYVAHLVHALDTAGEDHVGIGSDAMLTPFDTSPANLADWARETERRRQAGVGAPGEGPPPFVIGLNRPDRMQVIADALKAKGYRARIVDKVMGANFARVFAESWAV